MEYLLLIFVLLLLLSQSLLYCQAGHMESAADHREPNILDLPDNAMAQIFGHVEHADLYSLMQSSRSMKEAVVDHNPPFRIHKHIQRYCTGEVKQHLRSVYQRRPASRKSFIYLDITNDLCLSTIARRLCANGKFGSEKSPLELVIMTREGVDKLALLEGSRCPLSIRNPIYVPPPFAMQWNNLTLRNYETLGKRMRNLDIVKFQAYSPIGVDDSDSAGSLCSDIGYIMRTPGNRLSELSLSPMTCMPEIIAGLTASPNHSRLSTLEIYGATDAHLNMLHRTLTNGHIGKLRNLHLPQNKNDWDTFNCELMRQILSHPSAHIQSVDITVDTIHTSRIPDRCLSTIVESWTSPNTHLREFILNYNRIGVRGYLGIFQALQHPNNHIRVLDLRSTGVSEMAGGLHDNDGNNNDDDDDNNNDENVVDLSERFKGGFSRVLQSNETKLERIVLPLGMVFVMRPLGDIISIAEQRGIQVDFLQ